MSQPHRPDTSGFQPQKFEDKVLEFVDELFASVNPNPMREGCLSLEHINEIADGRRPLNDPGWRHMRNCSPCYRDFRAIRQSLDGQGFDARVVQ